LGILNPVVLLTVFALTAKTVSLQLISISFISVNGKFNQELTRDAPDTVFAGIYKKKQL
jgi:hypothetical protein